MSSIVVRRRPPAYHVYCDGSVHKDGRGGWGFAVYVEGQRISCGYGGEYDTTIGRMELTAAIEGLRAVQYRTGQITVFADAKYVIDGVTEYMDLWLRTNWRTSGNKPVKNADLWEVLGHLDCDLQPTWQWVKGHSGNPGNEYADQLAARGVPEKK